ncbi:MAG: purine-binding chemotaxis protein CheW [Clostridia bacterium]|nr:purine-binding chemotaxis protein CheW [Clostridia bacterium]
MEEELQLVAFTIDHEEFAVDILQVQEIEKIIHITRVPRSPNSLEGVINLRGEVIPVINLRKRLKLPLKANEDNNKIVIVKVNDLTVGIIVDGVSEVVRLKKDMIESSPGLVENIEVNYIKGVGKLGERLLILLDLPVILELDKQNDQTAYQEVHDGF